MRRRAAGNSAGTEGFKQRSFPVAVEDEGGAGDVADPARAERDVLERAPAFLQFGGGPLSECAQVSDQHVRGAGVGVQGLLGLAFRAAGWDADADAGADFARSIRLRDMA